MDAPSLPEHLVAIFDELVGEPLADAAVLQGEVETHLKLMRHAGFSNPQVNLPISEALALAGLGLLAHVDGDPDEGARRLVQAAVRYFALDSDADGDFASRDGLDDDVVVMNAVCRALGREDLVIRR